MIPGVVFSGSLDGHMRAFDAENGKVLWDFDTVREFTAVNGVAAKGGSLDGAGPVISGGMIFINSGYPRFGGMPGNVLLAFGIGDDNVTRVPSARASTACPPRAPYGGWWHCSRSADSSNSTICSSPATSRRAWCAAES